MSGFAFGGGGANTVILFFMLLLESATDKILLEDGTSFLQLEG